MDELKDDDDVSVCILLFKDGLTSDFQGNSSLSFVWYTSCLAHAFTLKLRCVAHAFTLKPTSVPMNMSLNLLSNNMLT
jgi:hypothetical protein